MSTEFLPMVEDLLQVTLFGKPVEDLKITSQRTTKIGQNPTFALIHGAKFLGQCHRLQNPFLAIVPDTGVDAKGCKDFDSGGFRMWELDKETPIITLSQQIQPVNEAIASRVHIMLDVNSDFRVYDVILDGTTLRGRIRAYLRLRQPGPFGSTIFDVTVIDYDDKFSFELIPGACITLFSLVAATAKICYEPNPNRICGEVMVGVDLPIIGHWGQNFTIACVNF